MTTCVKTQLQDQTAKEARLLLFCATRPSSCQLLRSTLHLAMDHFDASSRDIELTRRQSIDFSCGDEMTDLLVHRSNNGHCTVGVSFQASPNRTLSRKSRDPSNPSRSMRRQHNTMRMYSRERNARMQQNLSREEKQVKRVGNSFAFEEYINECLPAHFHVINSVFTLHTYLTIHRHTVVHSSSPRYSFIK